MKKCTKCLKTKELTEFYKHSKDYYRGCCKSCYIGSNKNYLKNYLSIHWKKYQNNKKTYQRVKRWRKRNVGKRNEQRARYRADKLNRTPKWLTKEDKGKIQEFYVYARLLTEISGTPHEVDHIIPLKGRNISGLHVPENLQILKKSDNRIKNNKF